MNIYFLKRKDNVSYNEFRSMVVVANTEEEALSINPAFCWRCPDMFPFTFKIEGDNILEVRENKERFSYHWAQHISDIEISLVGIADKKYKSPTVVCSDYMWVG